MKRHLPADQLVFLRQTTLVRGLFNVSHAMSDKLLRAGWT